MDVCNTVNCVQKRCSNKINLRDRKVFNALWQNCENTRWKCLCISAQLCTGYMECSLCRDQSWAVQLKNVYKFRSAYWLQGPRIAITFQWWKIIDGNRIPWWYHLANDDDADDDDDDKRGNGNNAMEKKNIQQQKQYKNGNDIDNGKAFAFM